VFVCRSTTWLLLPILLLTAFVSFAVMKEILFAQLMLRTSERIIITASLESQIAATMNSLLLISSGIDEGASNDEILRLASKADLQSQKT